MEQNEWVSPREIVRGPVTRNQPPSTLVAKKGRSLGVHKLATGKKERPFLVLRAGQGLDVPKHTVVEVVNKRDFVHKMYVQSKGHMSGPALVRLTPCAPDKLPSRGELIASDLAGLGAVWWVIGVCLLVWLAWVANPVTSGAFAVLGIMSGATVAVFAWLYAAFLGFEYIDLGRVNFTVVPKDPPLRAQAPQGQEDQAPGAPVPAVYTEPNAPGGSGE